MASDAWLTLHLLINFDLDPVDLAVDKDPSLQATQPYTLIDLEYIVDKDLTQRATKCLR